MTDNEIVKALECCIASITDCRNCPYYIVGDGDCVNKTKADVIDLVKRQQAEIDLLKIDNELMTTKVFEMAMNKAVADKVRAEAIKEFTDRLKSKTYRMTEYDEGGFGCAVYVVKTEDIDNLSKEMECGND